MGDIYLGIAVVAALSGALFVLGMKLSRRLSKAAALFALVLAVGVLVAFCTALRDSLLVARVLPLSNVIVLGNGQAPAAALAAGLAWGLTSGGRLRRALVLAPLLAVAAYRVWEPVGGEVPLVFDRWSGSVCRQTSSSTCSAAAAATLLASAGIRTSEAEMADLCLTRDRGTTMLGLYRGLALKTRGTPWRVEPFRCSLAELRASAPPPAILAVKLERGAGVDPRYQAQWGWTPGVAHTVVLFGFTPPGQVEIGDPAVGRERWGARDLEVLWHGQGLRLVRR